MKFPGKGKMCLHSHSETKKSTRPSERGDGWIFYCLCFCLSRKTAVAADTVKLVHIPTKLKMTRLNRAKRAVLELDDKAFITITTISEVNGNGFTWNFGDEEYQPALKDRVDGRELTLLEE
jgi:hypothetical protein